MKRIITLVIVLLASGLLLKSAGVFSPSDSITNQEKTNTEKLAENQDEVSSELTDLETEKVDIVDENDQTEKEAMEKAKELAKKIEDAKRKTDNEAREQEKEVEEDVVVEEKIKEEVKEEVVIEEKDTEEELSYDLAVDLSPVATIKVYMYEWQIDMSSFEMPSGRVSFEVANNGKRSHYFGIKGVKDFGKVLPGESKVFSAVLTNGTFIVYSSKEMDMQQNMMETIIVK